MMFVYSPYYPIAVPVFSKAVVRGKISRNEAQRKECCFVEPLHSLIVDGRLYVSKEETHDTSVFVTSKVEGDAVVLLFEKEEGGISEAVTIDTRDIIPAILNLYIAANKLYRVYESLPYDARRALDKKILSSSAPEHVIVVSHISKYHIMLGPVFYCPFGEDCTQYVFRMNVETFSGYIYSYGETFSIEYYVSPDTIVKLTLVNVNDKSERPALKVEVKSIVESAVGYGRQIRLLVPRSFFIDKTHTKGLDRILISVKETRKQEHAIVGKEAAKILAGILNGLAREAELVAAEQMIEDLSS